MNIIVNMEQNANINNNIKTYEYLVQNYFVFGIILVYIRTLKF